MFQVHRSNRTEELVEALARLVARPLGGPAAAECIVVQGRGMERWLSMQLARRLGIWANPSFPFPRKLIDAAMTAVLGEPDPGAAAWEPESLLWSVARILPEILPRPELAPLRAYLDGDERGLKRMQLARRIAATFDHYVVYRPDLVVAWERAHADDWQVVLWRRLRDTHGAHHFAARAARFLAEVGRGAPLAAGFPPRASLFGLSTLPPLYVRLLAALSERLDVHLFLLSPSRQYWADIRHRRELLRARQSEHGHLPSEEELAGLEGNPLLASLGRLGREFQEVLEATVDYEEPEELYREPGPTSDQRPAGGDRPKSALEILQSDILHLVHRGAGEPAPLPWPGDDDSIEIHSCHGPMREIEVLHDRLLALFESDPSLEPHDVVVMAPSIDAYTPYVEAVFRPGGADRPRIPFRIADRRARFTEEVSEAFFRTLDVLDGRFGASRLLDLLALDCVAARFGLAGDDLERARHWISSAGVRWGADAAHRAACDQPETVEHTWRFGLDRLLLGHALPGDGRTLFHGVLPCDEVEGSDGVLLGRLAEFCETLFRHRLHLRAARPPGAWRDDLTALLADVVASTNRSAHQHQAVREALAAVAERAAAAGFREEIALDAIRPLLEEEIQEGTTARGFLSGGVTFCELVPMRTVPFRVICLVGMNDGAFPRLRRPLGFDKMAQQPRLGDRSAREDDRYLFLEALLSARDRLLVTFTGQSIRDNSPLPPSVVVSELLDTLARSFRAADSPARTAVEAEAGLVRHPLQPFSPRNFVGADIRLRSFSARHFAAARALAAARVGADAGEGRAPFLPAPLGLEGTPPRRLHLDQLARFFENPSRAFLQQRLGLYLGRDLDPLEDREPLLLDNLERWQVGDYLLRSCATADEARRAFALVRAGGLLPPGRIGEAFFEEIAAESAAILEAVAGAGLGAALPPVEIDLLVGQTRLLGSIDAVHRAGAVRLQYSRVGRRHELGLWIRHLALNATFGAATTFLFARPEADRTGGVVRFRPVEGAAELLHRLVDLYWLGQSLPLPLFERASRAFARCLHEGGDDAWKKAREGFGDDDRRKRGCDAHDDSVRQIYGPPPTLETVLSFGRRFAPAAGAPVDAEAPPGAALAPFEEVAAAVLLPLLAHREENT